MNRAKLNAAIQEAKRFLKKVSDFDAACGGDRFPFAGTKESGAVKRASMDLSRALSDLRRPS